jgi:hypothetical protein
MKRDEKIQQELEGISKILKDLSSSDPYAVPEGYFDLFCNQTHAFIHAASDATKDLHEQSEQHAPILAGLNKRKTYTVDNDFFAKNAALLSQRVVSQASPGIIEMKYHGFIKRFSLAASVIGLIGMIIFLTVKKGTDSDMLAKVANIKNEKQINQELANMDTEDIIHYLDQYALPYDRSEIENYLDPQSLPDEALYFDESVLNELL